LAAAATGAVGAFGLAAAAEKAKVNRMVTMIIRVKNPILFIHFLLV
jgi:hypothetical protein